MDVGEILYLLNALVLGVFVGAQICEGALMVPQWKSIGPKEFFQLHKDFGPKIYRFFAPLTIAATMMPIITAIYAWVNLCPGYSYSLVAAIFALFTLSTFYLFFKRSNQSFADANLTDMELPIELDKWEKWHWTRIGLEMVSFTAALLALSVY